MTFQISMYLQKIAFQPRYNFYRSNIISNMIQICCYFLHNKPFSITLDVGLKFLMTKRLCRDCGHSPWQEKPSFLLYRCVSWSSISLATSWGCINSYSIHPLILHNDKEKLASVLLSVAQKTAFMAVNRGSHWNIIRDQTTMVNLQKRNNMNRCPLMLTQTR